MKLLKLNNISPRVLFLNDKTNNRKAVQYIEATSSDLVTNSGKPVYAGSKKMWNFIKNFKYSK